MARKVRKSHAQDAVGGGVPRDVIDRATLIARGLFPGADSFVTLIREDEIWSSAGGDVQEAALGRASAGVARSGQLKWIVDGALELADMAGEARIGGFVGAPIRLECGAIAGVLAVVTRDPLPEDLAKAAELQALADLIADECAHALITSEHDLWREQLNFHTATQEALLHLLPMSLLIIDTDMRVIGASRVWEKHLSLQGQDYLGRSLYELSPQVYEPFREAFVHALKGHHLSGKRVQVQRHDGPGHLWMQTEVVPWRAANGEIRGLMVLADDITEMVEALDKAERSTERLNIALELSSTRVWELDYERREIFSSGGGEALYENPRTFEQLTGDIFDSIDERDRDDVREAWRAHIEDGAPWRPVYRVARNDGREVWVESVVSIRTDDAGSPQRIVGAMRDVTRTRATELALIAAKEEAEASNQAKSTFLATMSHEIRTPLNGVLGMAQAMSADELSPTQRERLDVVRQSGEALLAILNDMLDLSKIEAGKLELEDSEFEIQELARGAYAAFTAIANKKGLSFDLKIEPEAIGIYRGDSTRVRQVLYNLLSNAIKFTDEGLVQVRVSRVCDHLKIAVRDSGIGIAPEALVRLFSKFEQADSTTTRRYGGTGLGLAICRELADLMGGSVAAESVVGEGSVFTLLLPLERVADAWPDAPAPPAPAALEDDAGDLPPLRVLAAEDNGVNRLVLQTLLHQVGIKPTVVEDGAQALAAWQAEPWDLILMDIQMPVMDGPTACREIRRREAAEGRARTPIIALTANAMAHQVAEYRSAGMDGFVSKPIEIGALFAAMNEALESATNPGAQSEEIFA